MSQKKLEKEKVTRVAAYGLMLDRSPTDADRILLCRLSDRVVNHAGYWTLPGGGLDFGERPEDGMVREVQEETGLDVVADGIAGVDSSLIDGESKLFHGVRIIYHTKLLGGVLANETDGTTDRCEWFTRKETLALELVGLARVGLGYAFPNQPS